MKIVQGYMHIIPNDPTGRGLLYFTEVAARSAKAYYDKHVEDNWDIEGKFDKTHWKEKPLPGKIYTLTIKEELT